MLFSNNVYFVNRASKIGDDQSVSLSFCPTFVETIQFS